MPEAMCWLLWNVVGPEIKKFAELAELEQWVREKHPDAHIQGPNEEGAGVFWMSAAAFLKSDLAKQDQEVFAPPFGMFQRVTTTMARQLIEKARRENRA